eukprot:gene10116-12408_t
MSMISRRVDDKYKELDEFKQSDQEKLDTFKAHLATTVYLRYYDGGRKIDPETGMRDRFIIGDEIYDDDEYLESIVRECLEARYFKMKSQTHDVIEDQVWELFDHIEKNGAQCSYPPPVKSTMPYYSLEEKLKRNFIIRQTGNKGEPIEHPRGFKLHVRPSSVDHEEAGYGVFVEGVIHPGTVIGFYPGESYFFRKMPNQIAMANEYMVSRYDGTVIDGRAWTKKADEMFTKFQLFEQTGSTTVDRDLDKFRNQFAIGNFINHPPLGERPNIIAVSYNFNKDFPERWRRYIPNDIVSESEVFKDGAINRSIVMVAFERITNSELFFNYRFNPYNSYPDWYHQPDLLEAKRRWGKVEQFSIVNAVDRLFN